MNLLSHYTNLSGLAGIVRSQEFWATEFKSLNDKTEISYSLGKITGEASKRLFLSLPDDLKEDGTLITNPEDVIRNVIHRLHDSTTELSGYSSWYFVSFAQGKDEDENNRGVKTLWDIYAQKEGYCLQFDKERIVRALAHECERYAYEFCDLVDVVYGMPNNTSEFDQLVEQMVFRFLEFVAGKYNRAELSPNFKSMWHLSLFGTRLLKFCSMHKDPYFKDEREVRIVVSPHQNSVTRFGVGIALKKSIENRGSIEKPVRYVKVLGQVIPGVIPSRILIGPKADSHSEETIFGLYPSCPTIVRPQTPDA
jgi:Protein of unknown function (DUF2971)